MTADSDKIKRIAKLAHIALTEEEVQKMTEEFSTLISFIDCLSEVDTTDVEPTTSITNISLPLREDKVTDGDKVSDILANAPLSDEGFFLVPKVVE